MPKIVFLDTNIYLHYQDINQIDWPKVLQTDAVTIVIPPVTIRELNKHKDSHSRPRIKKRAGVTLKRLSTLFESGVKAQIRDGVEVQFEDRDPLIDFGAHQLSREVQDDHLIASIVICRSEKPREDITLVTSDAGLTLLAKANRLGISATKLHDSLKLPAEPDPDQERIRELEQELRELKLKIPQLSVTFEDGSQRATFTLPRPTELAPEERERKLDEIKHRYPKLDPKPEESPKQTENPDKAKAALAKLMADRLASNTVSSEDVVKYNDELDKFYHSYTEYLQQQVRFQNLKHRTIRLAICLANDGTAPAEDIDVFMHFPDGFVLRQSQISQTSTTTRTAFKAQDTNGKASCVP
jgi:hypothetical protein